MKMVCNTCDKKKICKHYDYIVKATDVEMVVNKCDHNSFTFTATTAHHDFSKAIKPNSYPVADPGVALLNNKVSNTTSVIEKDVTVNYRDMSNKVNKDNTQDAFKVTAMPTKLSVCDNPNCKAETYEEDKTFCSVCGKPVCPVCSYADMHQLNNMPIEENLDATKTLKVICEDCHKASDVVPPKKKRGRPRKTKETSETSNPFGIDILGGEKNE